VMAAKLPADFNVISSWTDAALKVCCEQSTEHHQPSYTPRLITCNRRKPLTVAASITVEKHVWVAVSSLHSSRGIMLHATCVHPAMSATEAHLLHQSSWAVMSGRCAAIPMAYQ
jgi:hypothetical protein